MKLIIVLLLLVLGSAALVMRSDDIIKGNFFPLQKKTTVTINKHTFSAIVAKETKDVEIGLSKYSSLPQDQGMLFVFKKADIYPFWMRDMKFPIDIIFIKDNKVVTVHSNVQPPKSNTESIPVYKPSSASDKVFEVNAGLSEKYGIKEGNEVQFTGL